MATGAKVIMETAKAIYGAATRVKASAKVCLAAAATRKTKNLNVNLANTNVVGGGGAVNANLAASPNVMAAMTTGAKN